VMAVCDLSVSCRYRKLHLRKLERIRLPTRDSRSDFNLPNHSPIRTAGDPGVINFDTLARSLLNIYIVSLASCPLYRFVVSVHGRCFVFTGR